jgi:6-phosphogluconolactonase (cycloisomerase 2 family)
VTNTAENTISTYSVNGSTGALTAVSGSPFASGGTGPVSAATDPSGSFLVTANNGSSSVSVLRISNTSGALAAVQGSPFPTGSGPESVVTVVKLSSFDYVRSTTNR